MSAWREFVHAGIGNFCVNYRFHPTSVGWNLGLTWEFPTPIHVISIWYPFDIQYTIIQNLLSYVFFQLKIQTCTKHELVLSMRIFTIPLPHAYDKFDCSIYLPHRPQRNPIHFGVTIWGHNSKGLWAINLKLGADTCLGSGNYIRHHNSITLTAIRLKLGIILTLVPNALRVQLFNSGCKWEWNPNYED